MDLTEQIESLLPASDGWKWESGARYRLKHFSGSIWFGVQAAIVPGDGEELIVSPVLGLENEGAGVGVETLTCEFYPLERWDEAVDSAIGEAKRRCTRQCP